MKVTHHRKVTASYSYGGAYDLENEGFFTKDDLVEFDDLGSNLSFPSIR